MKTQINFKLLTIIIVGIFLIIYSCNSRKAIEHKESVNYIPYYLKVYKADSLNLIGKKEEAFKILDSLFNSYEPLNQDFYEEMILYLKLGNHLKKPIKSKEISTKLISKWGLNSDIIKKDSNLSSIIYTYLNKSEVSKYEDLYKSKINIQYRNEIIDMFRKDQKSRGKEDEVFVDEFNVKNMIELINQNGYPNRTNVGNLLGERVSIGIMYFHLSRTDYYQDLKNILYENLKNGNCSPEDIKKFIEAKYLIFYKYDYFGDADNFRKAEQKTSLDTFNERRKKYGLPSLEYAKWKQSVFSP